MRSCYVYILTSPGERFIPALLINIWYRILTHKQKKRQNFTKRYNITRLAYYEKTSYIHLALEREKEIKGWRRQKKILLIESVNPSWKDLAENWYEEEDFQD